MYESAVSFRLLAADDLEKAAENFKGAQPLAFVLKSESWLKTPDIWKTFFNGAFVIAGHTASSHPVFAFYNPILDGVLLTQWTINRKGKSVITAAAFAKGSDLNGAQPFSTNAAPAAWIDSPRTPPVAMAQALHQFIADFEALYPPAATTEAKLTTTPAGTLHLAVMTRHAALNNGIIAMLREKKYHDVGDKIWSFFTYLSTGDKAKLEARLPAANPLPVDKILEIPPELRKNFIAAYAAATDTTCLVFLSAPNFPQYLGALYLAADADGWTIRSFGFYDLVNMK